MTIQLKSADQTHYDAIALGEVLMRIDPGQVPTARARTARIWHGGGRDQCRRGLKLLFRLARRRHHGPRGRRDRPQH